MSTVSAAKTEARPKIVILTGAGLSAPSGLATFRDANGLWANHRIEDVATPDAWRRNPELVLEFYNQRRTQACAAQPNAGHRALAALERRFEVVIVTQNVDDLHERAGSTRVIHLHGELTKARSTADESLVYDIGARAIRLGDCCARGSQLRPHIVWFGEEVPLIEAAAVEFADAAKVLVAGTSLQVYPAAGLVAYAPAEAERVHADLQTTHCPFGFRALPGSVEVTLPALVATWLA
ncbi:MAG TPA: Sir2 family NAD-dependent protein deacetylase [Opitutaceae bacterium]|nr:Sir2 family NAD-dependent protein deacetylase [Opitutaceae bacterium]